VNDVSETTRISPLFTREFWLTPKFNRAEWYAAVIIIVWVAHHHG